MQLIFLVETNSKNKSDFIYIDKLIKSVYDIDDVKITPIYLNGSGNYSKKNSIVNEMIKRYKKNGISHVFVCLDTDDMDISNNKKNFIEKACKYTEEKGWDFIWFNSTIEEVFFRRKVEDNLKKIEATKYKYNKDNNLNLGSLDINSKKSSNICKVLDKYLFKTS